MSKSNRLSRKTSQGAVIGATGLSLIAAAVTVVAATPPANSVIGNQASVSYTDPTGVVRNASSNLVQTTVQQVGAMTLSGAVAKTSAAGSTVYMPHVLTNTGNGSDTFTITAPAATTDFTRVEVFLDTNGDGMPDSTSPICSSSGSPVSCTTGAAVTLAGNGAQQGFVVAYTVSPTASGWPAAGRTGVVTVTAGTPAMYSTTSLSVTDTVQLTTGPAFNATMSLSVPSVAAPGGGSWPAAIASGKAAPVGSACPTTWAPSLATAPPVGCNYVTYTVRYANNGGTSGDFTFIDAIPAGLTYVAGSAVWSGAGGTALGDGAGADPAGVNYDFNVSTAGSITATIRSVAPNVTGTVSFVALVNSNATPTAGNTTNTANYYPGTCDPSVLACSGATQPTNGGTFTVLPTYGTVAANVASTTRDTATPPVRSGIDSLVVASAAAGGNASWSAVISNTGNATDTFNLSTSCSAATTPACAALPAGTQLSWFRADGVTPLLDTTGDGIVDTGPVAAGGNTAVVLRATLPATASVVGTGPFQQLITAKSVGDLTNAATSSDSVWVQLTQVLGSLVDLTNTAAGSVAVVNGDLGPGPSASPTQTASTPAGTGVTFPLFVRNNDTVNNTYTLLASQSQAFPGSLPAGWAVKFVATGGNCSSAAITSVAVTAGGQADVLACVTPPAGQAVGTTTIYFQVKSTSVSSTGVLVSDVIGDAVTVTVAPVAMVNLLPNGSGQAAPGSSVVFPHTLSNVGNQSCGAFTVAASFPAAEQAAGWMSALYVDVNGDGQVDAGDTLITTGTLPALTAAQQSKLLVKVFAPAGASSGASAVATLVVTDSTAACPAVTVTDTITVISGDVRVTKVQAADLGCNGTVGAFGAAPLALKPGQCVVYRAVATNESAVPVFNTSVSATVPLLTTHAGAAQPAVQCSSAGLTGTAVALATTGAPVSGLTCGSASNTLAPGGTITLSYSVKVNP